MSTSRITDSVGRVLGDRYRLARPLGVGASAQVFAAEDVRLRRRVAVKVLHPALAGEQAFLRRFRREAQAVASLRHPNILRVYDWGEDGGSPYLVMELLEGGSLRSMLDRGALLSSAQAAAVGADAARALDYAHRQGLVHRDIKPANLLFDDEGRVSVADFGLARALAEAAWTEPAGAVVGTARYASPELVRGENLDEKADVYSLALVLVEAVTGRVPFATDTAIGTLMARVGRPLEAPDQAGPLKPVLEAAGALDPAARIDAAELARRLDAVAESLPFPAPLSLVGPLDGGYVESDGASPTEFPGRPKLFDRAEWEAEDGTPPEVAGAGGWPAEEPAVPVTAAPRAVVTAAPGAAAGAVTPPNGAGAGIPAVRAPGPPTAGVPAPAAAASDPPPRPRRRRLRRAAAVGAATVVLVGGAGTAWAVLSGRLKPEEPVPDLVGRSRAEAAAALGHEHLRLAVSGSQYSPTRPAGAVLTQLQPPGSKLRQGRTVQVLLSLGPQPVPVPDLHNDSLQAAEQVLQNLGLKWSIASRPDPVVGPDQVISNSPDSGTLVPGQQVGLLVSTGKPKVPVPPISVQTETYAQAAAALGQAGLVPKEVDEYDNTVPKGAVVSVDPPSGTSIPVGSTVTLTVSKGPHYVTVPSTTGDSVGTASEILGADGFNVAAVSGNPLNTVRRTDPAGGSQALFGASVTIITG